MTNQRDRLESQLEGLDRRITRLLDAIEAGQGELVQERLSERQEERRHVTGCLEAVSAEIARSRLQISPEALRYLVDNMSEVLASSDPVKVRRLLRTFIARVEASRDGGTLYYVFPVQSIGSTGLGALPKDCTHALRFPLYPITPSPP